MTTINLSIYLSIYLVIMNRSAELLLALSEDKEEKKLTVLFLAVVNIVLLRTNLLICGDKERSLAGNGLGFAPSLS